MINFKKVHVLNDEDLTNMIEFGDCTCFDDIDVNTVDFSWDYAEMALLDADKKVCVIWNDNIHTQVEEEIDAFIDGAKYTGVDVLVEEIVMMSDDLKDGYSGVRY